MNYKMEQFSQTSPGTMTAETSDITRHDPLGMLPSGQRGCRIDGVDFIFDKVDRTPDGEDIAGWWLRPSMGAAAKFPNVLRVLIIND